MSEERERARGAAKTVAARAVKQSNLTYKEIGAVLAVSYENTFRRFEGHQQHGGGNTTYGVTYTDLWMLSLKPETAELVRLLLAPLLERVERHSLRIADLDRLASNSHTTEVARIALKPTAALLWPEKFADTRPVSSTEK